MRLIDLDVDELDLAHLLIFGEQPGSGNGREHAHADARSFIRDGW